MNNTHIIFRRRSVRGLTLLELIGALAIVAIITAAAIPVASRYIEDNKGRVIADQVSKMVGPANAYINANYAAIAATATATNPYVISPATLQTSGFLDSTMNLNNAYGQGYQIAVLQPTAGVLEGIIVSTGGVAISEREMPLIAQQIGGAGGYVSGQSALGAAFAQGSYGGWKKALASYGVSPGTGHVAAALFYSSLSTVDDSLHRHATAGQPQYQQMSAAIDMNNNNLNNAGTVTAKQLNLPAGNTINIGGSYIYGDSTNLALRAAGGGVYLQTPSGGSANIFQVHNINGDATSTFTAQYMSATTGLWSGSYVNTNGSMLAGGNISANGDLTANGAVYSSNWFRSYGNTGWYNQTYGGGLYMADGSWLRSYNDKGIYTGGQVQAGTIQSNGRLTANEYIQFNGTAAPGGGCSPDGLAAKASDGTGLLQCKGGIWVGMGGISRAVNVYGAVICSSGGNGPANYTYCPAGYKAINAGHDLTYYNNGSNWWMANNGPDSQYILDDASGAYMKMGGSAGYSCVRQVVTCAQ